MTAIIMGLTWGAILFVPFMIVVGLVTALFKRKSLPVVVVEMPPKPLRVLPRRRIRAGS